MIQADVYVDLHGTRYVWAVLDAEERQLVKELKDCAKRTTEWAGFRNTYIQKVGDFYQARGLTRQEITRTPVWAIAQDLAGGLHIAANQAKRSDYRDELELLIQSRFGSRRAFCDATGLSVDMLNQVLAKRKNFGIETFSPALERIGYVLHIAPISDVHS
jgi:hypothetical protein